MIRASSYSSSLQFRLTEGRVLNAFYQQGPMAAYMLLSSGMQPRLLVGFPAVNSRVGVWFDTTQRPVQWTLGQVKGVSETYFGRDTLMSLRLLMPALEPEAVKTGLQSRQPHHRRRRRRKSSLNRQATSAAMGS